MSKQPSIDLKDSNTGPPKDELDACNDQTYEEILQRFYLQKQRMQESPERGDVIRHTNSCIVLEEEYFEVIPCDENNQQKRFGPRDKQRVMSTKVCDDGCNYIKETVIERTISMQEGLLIKTKHIIKKCNTADARKNSITYRKNYAPDTRNGSNSTETTRKIKNNRFGQRNLARLPHSAFANSRGKLERENDRKSHRIPSTSSDDERSDSTDTSVSTRNNIMPGRNRLGGTRRRFDSETPKISKPKQSSPSHGISMQSCQNRICCQAMPAIQHSCYCSISQHENNHAGCRSAQTCCSCVCQNCRKKLDMTLRDERVKGPTRHDIERQKRIDFLLMGSNVTELTDITPPEGLTSRSSKSNSGLNQRATFGARPFLSSTKYDNENVDEEIENISIQLYNSSASSRPYTRSRHECECEEKCCITPSKSSKLLAEIIIPNEYNCGIPVPLFNENRQRSIAIPKMTSSESSKDSNITRTPNAEVLYRSIATSTRNERSRKRKSSSREDIQDISEPAALFSRTELLSTEHRLDDVTPPTDMDGSMNDTTSREAPNQQKLRDERYRNHTFNEEIDNISPPEFDDGFKLDDETPPIGMDSSASSRAKNEDNARQNSRPMRTIMVPLVYVSPNQGCSRSCRCRENQPRLIPFSVQYRTVDEDESEDCNDFLKRKLQNERANRR